VEKSKYCSTLSEINHRKTFNRKKQVNNISFVNQYNFINIEQENETQQIFNVYVLPVSLAISKSVFLLHPLIIFSSKLRRITGRMPANHLSVLTSQTSILKGPKHEKLPTAFNIFLAMSATALRKNKMAISSINHQNLEFFSLVPKSPNQV
jgi:hypothetical protein